MIYEKKKIFITDYDNRVLQLRHMYDSMDYEYIKQELLKEFPDMIFLTFNEIRNDIGVSNIKDCKLFFTSSQMLGYKSYVEETMIALNTSNVLYPKLEVLLSHENKSFQEMYLQLLGVETNIKSWTFGDLKSLKNTNFNFPVITKINNGSSSSGVKFCNSYNEIIRFVKRKTIGNVLNELLSVPIKFWFFHLKELKTQRNFLVQEKVDNRKGEWRLEWHSGRIIGFYRELKKNKKYASGGSLLMKYDIPEHLLDYVEKLSNIIGSPHIIFDIIDSDKIYLIEFSGIHTGQNSILKIKDNRYYQKVDNKWEKIDFKLSEKTVEEFYVRDVVETFK